MTYWLWQHPGLNKKRTVHKRLTFPLLTVSSGSDEQYFCLESSAYRAADGGDELQGEAGVSADWGSGVGWVLEKEWPLWWTPSGASRGEPCAFSAAFHSDSHHHGSHAALTQSPAANLAWPKHGLQLSGGSDATPWPLGGESSRTGATPRPAVPAAAGEAERPRQVGPKEWRMFSQ